MGNEPVFVVSEFSPRFLLNSDIWSRRSDVVNLEAEVESKMHIVLDHLFCEFLIAWNFKVPIYHKMRGLPVTLLVAGTTTSSTTYAF